MRRLIRACFLAALLPAAAVVACNDGGGTGPSNPAIGLAVSQQTLAVAQGASATTGITISRTDFSGSVTLSATGLPSGVSASFDPATLGSGVTASVLTLTATANATSGPATIVVHATGSGVSEKTAQIDLTVIVPGGVTPVSLDRRCLSQYTPVWFAYQNLGGSWTTVSPVNDVYTFNATERFAVAVVSPNYLGGYETFYGFMTLTGIAHANGRSCAPPASVVTASGLVPGLTSSMAAIVSAGPATEFVIGPDSAYTLSGIPATPVDLAAGRFIQSTTGIYTDKLIVRRALSIANGSTIPRLDFAAAEAFAAGSATYSLANVGSDGGHVYADFVTATQTVMGTVMDTARSTFAVYGLPSDKLAVGDLHEIEVDAYPADTSNHSRRSAILFQHQLAGATLSLGPVLATPTVTVAATSPVTRLRLQLPVQSEYASAVGIAYQGGVNSASVYADADYFGTITTWDLTMPDLSAVAGWNNAWGLGSGTINWDLQAMGGVDVIIGQNTTDGLSGMLGSRSSQTILSAPVGVRALSRANRGLPALTRSRSAWPLVKATQP